MRFAIHVVILLCSLIGGGFALRSAIDGESGWNGVIVAGIVFGFAAANLTLLEIRNWIRVSGHRQQSRLWRMLSAPVAEIEQPRRKLPVDPDVETISSESQQALLPDADDRRNL